MAHIKDIIGYEKQVRELERICDFLKNTDKYINYDVELPNYMLICGREGVGKTFMAEALISDSGRETFYYKGNGKNVKALKSIFKKAKKSANSIIFIDDLDYVTLEDDCPVYDRLVKELEDCQNSNVFVVATAIKRDNLPDYLLEEFDSDMVIELASPKIEEACGIFKPIFAENKTANDFNLNDFCCFAQEWTYNEVLDAFNNAARLSVYERDDKVSMQNLIKEALRLKGYELAEEFNEATAYHEAGHAAVSLLLGGDAACIVLLETDSGLFKEKEWKTKTYHDKERRYIVSVAGKACEEIFTGTSSIGSYTDLGRVREAIEDDIKILASQGFEYFDSTELNSPAYNDTLAKKVQSDIQKYYDKAKELIVENRPLIEAFVDNLKDKHYLLHSEIYKIYDAFVAEKKSDLKVG